LLYISLYVKFLINRARTYIRNPNIRWQLIDKFSKIFSTLLFNVFLLKTQGPEFLGAYSYVLSLGIILVAIASFGMPNVVLSEFSLNKSKSLMVLSSAVCIKFILAIFVFLVTIFYLNYSDHLLKQYEYIISFTILIQAFDAFEYYLQAHHQLAESLKLRVKVTILFLVFKILIIFIDPNLEYIIVCYVLESFFTYIFVSFKTPRISYKYVNINYMQKLIKRCIPIALSSFFAIALTRVDQLIIGNYVNLEALGYYNSILSFITILLFIPSVMNNHYFPILGDLISKDYKEYMIALKQCYKRYIVAGLIISALPFVYISGIVFILIKVDYLEWICIGLLYSLTNFFVAIALFQAMRIALECFNYYGLFKTALSFVVVVALSYIFVINFGVIGAPVAVLIALILTEFIFPKLIKHRICCFNYEDGR
jgi:O-antigen/teichoic acid export membrane protein